MAPRKSVKKANIKPVGSTVQQTKLVATLTPITDGSGIVRRYVDYRGRYDFGPKEEREPAPIEISQHASDAMMDNDKLVDLLKPTGEYVIVFQPANQTEEKLSVKTQSQSCQEDSSGNKMSKKQFQEMEEVFILEEGIELDKDGNVVEDLASEHNEEAGNATDYVEEDAVNAKTRLVQQKKNNRYGAVYHCPKCAYSSNRRYSVVRHLKAHSGNRPFVCTYCDHKFKTVLVWQNHLNTHKRHKPHICAYCQRPFTTSGELIRHVRYKHTLEKPHKCNECEYASVELSKLRRHQRCHTGERPYQCQHCTYAAQDPFKLKRHLRTHTGEKPYQCDKCQLCFTQANSLKAHQHKHDVAATPMFNCVLCPTKCRRKSDLRIHVKNMHSTQKQYKCRCCGKFYSDRYTYKIHMKSHNGEKCYKCDSCPFTTATVRYLTNHLLKHTGEKPFQCDRCNQAFRQKQLLRRHQNLNHNPKYLPPTPREKRHQCNKCPQKFVNSGNLNRHLTAHKSKKSDAEEEDNINVTPPTEDEVQAKTARSLNCKDIHMVEMDEDEDTIPLIQLLRKSKAKNLLQESSTGIDNCFGFASDEEDLNKETPQVRLQM